MKTFKHKKTGEIMTYQNGVMQVGRIVIEGEPNLDFWKEVKENEDFDDSSDEAQEKLELLIRHRRYLWT